MPTFLFRAFLTLKISLSADVLYSTQCFIPWRIPPSPTQRRQEMTPPSNGGGGGTTQKKRRDPFLPLSLSLPSAVVPQERLPQPPLCEREKERKRFENWKSVHNVPACEDHTPSFPNSFSSFPSSLPLSVIDPCVISVEWRRRRSSSPLLNNKGPISCD